MLSPRAYKRLVAALSLALLLVGTGWIRYAPSVWAQEREPAYTVRVLSSDEHSVMVEMEVHDYQWVAAAADDGNLHQLAIGALAQSADSDFPQVPFYAAAVGVPTLTGLELRVIERQYVDLAGHQLPAAPLAQIVDNGPETAADALFDFTQPPDARMVEVADKNPAWGESNVFLPQDSAQVIPIGGLQGQPAAQIILYPVQYRANDQMTRVLTKQVVEVRWDESVLEPVPAIGQVARSTASQFPTLFLNEAWLMNATVRERKAVTHDDVEQMDNQGTIIKKIVVREDGMYKIDVSGETDVDSLVIHNRYCRVPTHLIEADGEKFLLFYGMGIHRPYPGISADDMRCRSVLDDTSISLPGDKHAPDYLYTDENVYWLVSAPVEALDQRMKTEPPVPSTSNISESFSVTRHFEENNAYWHGSGRISFGPQAAPEDHWFWAELTVTPTAQNLLSIGLPITETTDVTLTMHAKSFPLPEGRRYNVKIGDANMQELSTKDGAYGTGVLTSTYTLATDLSGANSITIGLDAELDNTSDDSSSLLDWIQITYDQQFVAGESTTLLFGRTMVMTETIRLYGFSGGDTVYVFDITTPYSPTIITDTIVSMSNPVVEFTLGSLDGLDSVACQNTAVLGRCYLAVSERDMLDPLDETLAQEYVQVELGDAIEKIVIVPNSFVTEMTPIFKTSVLTVTAEYLYDRYNAGIANPRAIRDFLAYTYQCVWQETEMRADNRYVLLAGDAVQTRLLSHEPGDSVKKYIELDRVTPAYKFESALYNEVTSDLWLAMLDRVKPVDGQGADKLCDAQYKLMYGSDPVPVYYPLTSDEDYIPDVMIGRVPSTQNELQQYWGKAAYYATRSIPHRGRALYVADDETKFHNLAQSLAHDLEVKQIITTTSYLIADIELHQGQSAPPYFPDRSDDNFHQEVARQIINELNGTELATVDSPQTGQYDLVTYVGHGNYNSWGYWDVDADNVEDAYILLKDDLDTTFTVESPDSANSRTFCLNNSDRLPFVMVGNCLNGFYAGNLDMPSIAEVWLTPDNTCEQSFDPRIPDPKKGAIAVFAPSGLGYPSGHETLLLAMNQALAENDFRLGALVNKTIAETVAGQGSAFWKEMAMTYTLFGDPSLQLNLPTSHYSRLPIVHTSSTSQ